MFKKILTILWKNEIVIHIFLIKRKLFEFWSLEKKGRILDFFDEFSIISVIVTQN